MSVDPKGDVDICITCLTKKPPKLPLREELPSLGVELIYKAQGVGAKTSKQMARRAAKDFSYNESFKDLQKRRFFPKSSKRIKGILEERKRREAELKNESSAVSYESYQSELYGGWVTDTSSSGSSKTQTKSTASSKVSGVSAINTTGNRRMTKTALKKWKLFRIKSQKRKDKSQKKKTKAKLKDNYQDNKSRATLDSLIGEEVFTDFLTPLPPTDGGSDSDSSFDDIFPSWYPEKLKERYRKKTELSPLLDEDNPQNKPAGKQVAAPRKDPPSDYFRDDDFPSVGWNDESTTTDVHVENPSPSSYGRPAPSFLDSDQYEAYPEAKSPPPYKPHGSGLAEAKTPPSEQFMSKFSKTFQLNGTPTTMATTPATTPVQDSSCSVESSLVSSISGSEKQHAEQKQRGKKQSGYASAHPETQEQVFVNNFKSQDESASDSSLIGLNVAFPRDGQELNSSERAAINTPTHSPTLLLGEENDVDISGTIDTPEQKRCHVEQETQVKEKDEHSGIFDTVLSYVFNNKTPVKEEASASVNSPSDTVPLTPTTNPFDDESSKVVEIQEPAVENSEKVTEESPLKFFHDLPEQFLKAFSNERTPETKEAITQTPDMTESSVHEDNNKEQSTESNENSEESSKTEKNDDGLVVPEVIEGTLVFPLHDGIEEMNSFQPIVLGHDVEGNDQYSDDSRRRTKTWQTEASASHRSSDNKEEVRKKKKSLKWWKGSFPKFRHFLKNKKISTRVGSAISTGEDPNQSISAEISSHLSGQAETRASRKQSASIKGYESGPNRYPIIEVKVDSEAKDKGNKEQRRKVQLDKSTALAFSNIPDSFYISFDQNANKEKKSASGETSTEEKSFHHVVRETQLRLTHYETEVEEISKVINEDLTIAYLKDPDDGQMLLHRFASSPFPSHVDSNDFLSLLMADIRIFKEKLELIYVLFPAASEVVDGDNDLPVHRLARNLMEWETTWYSKLYGLASKETAGGAPGGTATRAITTLYHTMSLCVETLLQRVVHRPDLCRQRGSLGSLLPLHIATVFTSSISILRHVLEAYPAGAFEAAWVKGFQSFVPNGCLPLELHDAFCTDFPKWEVEVSSGEGTKWSKTKEDKSNSSVDNRIRRSDLLFAYNPSITKFWKDRARIRRIERQINYETIQAAQTGHHDLSSASKRLWIWLCTFSEADGDHAIFAKSVCRIIDDLPMSLVRLLGTIPAANGEAVLDIAHPECVDIIRKRFDTLADAIAPIVSTTQSSRTGSSRIFDSWDDSRHSNLRAANHVTMGQVCRSIFNVRESDIPTSFVILPYRLDRRGNGALQITPTESSAIAVKFADSLLKMTDPRSVLYYLDRKSEEYFGVSMYEDSEDASARAHAFNQIKLFEKQFLEIYRSTQAYLYLLDEDTGAPIVANSNNIYPIPLQHPEDMVRKLLPLMIAGMIQMRGEKGVSILATVLLDESISLVPSHYASSAEALKHFMDKVPSANEYALKDAEYIQEELERFLSGKHLQKVRQSGTLTSTTEWNVELSILRMLFEYNDPTRNFSGLERSSTSDGDVIQWIFREDKGGFHEAPSHSTEDSLSEPYRTLRAHPLKFPQPQDDTTESPDGSQESQVLQRLSDVDIGLAPSLSEETTESQFLSKRSRMLSETFAVNVRVCSSPHDDTGTAIWNPAEQVWVDVRNRLEVTGYFWDEARVTRLRVALLEQANKLCQLQNRIKGIREEESTYSSRVKEIFCKMMGDDMNVLEVPSLRTLFKVRHLITRMNELEDKLMENEIDVQHLDLGVRLVHQEILDLIPTLEDETSSNQWSDSSDSSSSSSNSQTQTNRDLLPANSARETLSDQAIQDTFTSEALARHPERIRRAFANARKRNATRVLEENETLSAYKSQVLLATSTSGENDGTKVSSLTTRSSSLREKVAAARSRAMVASQPTIPPSEIALPTLNHLILGRDTSGLGEQSSSSSSTSFENTSIVKYNKERGLIEF